MALRVGQLLQGRYLIERPIGQGGYAAVYRAFDQRLNHVCAIKENLDVSPQAVEQFTQEAQILGRLHHPNLPRVIDHFLIPGQGQYLVMDYIAGQSLHQLVQTSPQPLPVDRALAIITQVCAALEYLHSQQPPVIHRDVKPQNVIITPEDKAVLVDFGIAKFYTNNQATRTVARAYTPGYAAPEQYGATPTDERSDVYAVGATLYTLLTGRQPPDVPDRWAHQMTIPSVRVINPAVNAAVERVTLKALELSADKRFPSIREFRRHLLAPPVVASTRHRAALWSTVAMTAGLCVLLGLIAWWLLRLTPLGVPAGVTPTAVTPRPTFTPTVLPTATPLPVTRQVALAVTAAPITVTATVSTVSLAAAVVTATITPSPTALVADESTEPSATLTQSIDLPTLIGFVVANDSNSPPTIYQMDTRTGQRTQIVDGADPAWSPDGRRLAYVVAGQGIWLRNVDGSNPQQLTSENDWQPAWSPDGSELALMSFRSGRRQIYKMTVAGGNLVQLTTQEGEARHPAWSPAGQTLAFISNRSGKWQIWLMGGDGADPRPLPNTNDSYDYFKPTWSPNGQMLVFGVWTGNQNEIWVYDVAEQRGRPLVTQGVYKLEGAGYGLAWSAAGWIAYVAEQRGNAQLAAIRAHGGAAMALTADDNFTYFPVWLGGE